jgi:3-hydroxyacyl-CoA dehydrogenase / enoyl-CoA hydratase / 3-hydroxybutyryl-CoA epimerase
MATDTTETATDPSTAAPGAPARLAVEDGIAWLVLDDPEKKLNTLSTRFFNWFEEATARLENERPEALVVLSGKPDSFVAGADISELQGVVERAPVLAMLQRGHALMARLGALPFPTVAAIHGACLGGGLELALACDRRVATDHPKTRLGLPEVQLGLIPGLGGTQRLPRLIGVADALDLILTARQVDARKALRLGLVDAVCHPLDLRQAAERLAREGKRRPRRAPLPLAKRAGELAARTPLLADRLVWEKARAGVLQKTGGHYPRRWSRSRSCATASSSPWPAPSTSKPEPSPSWCSPTPPRT